ncbi:MAG TPA: Gfo/Idh/MocA family oxidoreductase [Streptosporangiaceae bacterium]|nr:Gfo/Idh/MocA family oxidoreductase [Streptosporangiaceae bacterium]
MYRIGLIGAGFLTRAALLPALEAAGADFAVAAVLDPSPEALAAVAARLPGVLITAGEDAFFEAGLDAVHVATPNACHDGPARRAFGLGLAVLVDKPLADTVQAGARIVAAAREAGTVGMVGYMSRHNAHNRAAAGLISSGAIGEPLTMSAVHLGHRCGGWRTRRAESGLGSLGDLAIYPVLTATDLFGPPEGCRATAFPAGDPELTDLHAEGTLHFPGGRRLRFESSFLTEAAGVGVSRYTVIGTAGVLVVHDSWAMNGGGRVLLCDRAGRRVVDVARVDPYAEQYRQLAACLRGRPVPEAASLERGLRDLGVLVALEQSAVAGGRLITLPGGELEAS